MKQSKLIDYLRSIAAFGNTRGRDFVVVLLLSGCGALPDYGALEITGPALPEATREISVTTWNVGYGALGAGADFIADGGTHMRALDAQTIAEAADAIGQKAGTFGSQFILLQELANGGALTRGVPVQDVIEENLGGYSRTYWQDLGVSEPLRTSHGMGVYGRNLIASVRSEELPQEPGYFFLNVKRYYAAIVSEMPIRGSDRNWVLIKIHLSAFDKDASVRRSQIAAVFDLAKAEYAKGNYVVIGGDWNMKISPTEFPNTTEIKDLFWVFDFPNEMLPEGWSFAADKNTPTVRTLYKPYVAGENYTMIIDGFAYSPNVVLRRVSTQDLGFEHSDHHPVTARFAAR